MDNPKSSSLPLGYWTLSGVLTGGIRFTLCRTVSIHPVRTMRNLFVVCRKQIEVYSILHSFLWSFPSCPLHGAAGFRSLETSICGVECHTSRLSCVFHFQRKKLKNLEAGLNSKCSDREFHLAVKVVHGSSW